MSFELRRDDVSALALGSAVLGTGGGGNSYYGQLVARRVLDDASVVKVIGIEEMEPASYAITSAAVGAPLVCLEKPPSMLALQAGFECVKGALPGSIGAFFAAEIGGLQCMFPLILAAQTGMPLLDGDGMGRAFPEVQMATFAIYGTTPGLPSAVSGDRGLLFDRISEGPQSPETVRESDPPGIAAERFLRRVCAEQGGLIYMTAAFDHPSLMRTLVRGSIELALRIGKAIESARNRNAPAADAIVEVSDGRQFIAGKVVDLERQFRAGHDWGRVRIEGVEGDKGRRAEIDFKNEYLVLRLDDQVVLTVPDLITLIETETGTPVSTDILRPGLRVTVLGLPCSRLLSTERALRSVGPAAFGYDLPYVPLSKSD